jgi:hypothetical protein
MYVAAARKKPSAMYALKDATPISRGSHKRFLM